LEKLHWCQLLFRKPSVDLQSRNTLANSATRHVRPIRTLKSLGEPDSVHLRPNKAPVPPSDPRFPDRETRNFLGNRPRRVTRSRNGAGPIPRSLHNVTDLPYACICRRDRSIRPGGREVRGKEIRDSREKGETLDDPDAGFIEPRSAFASWPSA
jgi:hypothetical protein